MLRQFRHKLVSQCTDLGNQERPLSAQTSGCGDPIWTRNRKYVQKNGYEFWLPISIKKAEGVCSRPLSVLAYHRVKFRLTRKVALCVNSTPLLNRPRSQLVPTLLWSKIWFFFPTSLKSISTLVLGSRVHIFWEGHKIWKNLTIYLILLGIFFQTFVAFSECLNFR